MKDRNRCNRIRIHVWFSISSFDRIKHGKSDKDDAIS
jgi:hypothetical protein